MLFISIMVIPHSAISQDLTAQKIDCHNAQSTVEMKFCSQQSYAAADKRLNQVYRQVIANADKEQRQLLVTAQKAWINFRDNNCNFESYFSRGGTGYEIFRNECLERLTKQRTQDLETYLSK